MTKPTVPAAVWPPAIQEARTDGTWHRVALQESGHDPSRYLATQRKRHQLLTELGHRYLYGFWRW